MARSTLVLSSCCFLVSFGLGAALGGPLGCGKDCGEWSAPEVLELGVDADLLAVAVDPAWDGEGTPPFYAVGAGGLIVASGDTIRSDQPVAVDLRDVGYHGEFVIAVGDAGTVVRASQDGSSDWEVVDVGVTQDLYAVVPNGQGELVLGEDVLLVHDGVADTWTPAPRPTGGWGSLRASLHDSYDGTRWVFGLAGVAWSTRDPLGTWERVDLDTDADLVAVTGGGSQFVVGSDGVILERLGGVWHNLGSDTSVDFVAAADPDALLTADGRLLGLSNFADGGLRRNATLDPGMTAVAVGYTGDSLQEDMTAIVVGAGGRTVHLEYKACEVRL